MTMRMNDLDILQRRINSAHLALVSCEQNYLMLKESKKQLVKQYTELDAIIAEARVQRISDNAKKAKKINLAKSITLTAGMAKEILLKLRQAGFTPEV